MKYLDTIAKLFWTTVAIVIALMAYAPTSHDPGRPLPAPQAIEAVERIDVILSKDNDVPDSATDVTPTPEDLQKAMDAGLAAMPKQVAEFHGRGMGAKQR